MVGDIVATRRNDRRLRTTTGEPIRNRERWTITDTNQNGEITVTRLNGHGTITLPADYVRQHVQLAYATTEHGAQGDTANRSITLATTATTGRGLYVGMTRGRDENHALVVTDTPELAEAIGILEAAITIDRADIPATTHRRALAAAVPRSEPQPRVQIPEWFAELRAIADEQRQAAHQELARRNSARAGGAQRVAEARRKMPAAAAAHAPFREKVVAAERVVNEARSGLRSAEYGLRKSGRLGRRSARRDVESATDVLAAAIDRLAGAEDIAAPTRAPLDELRSIIDDHRQFDATRRTVDRWNDLDGAADRASELCKALDQWKNWADGRDAHPKALAAVATTLRAHQAIPGVEQVGQALARWAEAQGIELESPQRSQPSNGVGIEL